jgi:methylmalonyl-CoA/ethylmalonyl-CoA epimerase
MQKMMFNLYFNFQLLHPLGEKSPIKAFLDKNAAGGIHHICIEVKTETFNTKSVKTKKNIPT